MQSLIELNVYSNEEFKTWLDDRLREQYVGDQVVRRRACDFRQLGVPIGESNIDSLRDLFSRLSEEGKESFKAALFLLISSAIKGEVSVEMLKDILTLIAVVKAEKAASILEKEIIRSSWGRNYPHLIYDSLGVMMSLGIPTKSLCQEFGFE